MILTIIDDCPLVVVGELPIQLEKCLFTVIFPATKIRTICGAQLCLIQRTIFSSMQHLFFATPVE
jgi:hypothetical protein